MHITEHLLGKIGSGRLQGGLTDLSEWVCRTCYVSFCAGKLPACSWLKYAGFVELPSELQGLSTVEADLIALRIAFMKIRGLGIAAKNVSKKSNPFGQLCLSGMVVNVPTDLSKIQTLLPAIFSPEDTVTVNIKRRLCYKGFYESENVRPFKVMLALRYLVEHDTLWKASRCSGAT